MIFYFGRNYTSRHVASRIADVRCDKCGCQYYYELRRTAIGQASAPYGLGAEAASDAAVASSKREVANRLRFDSEPVPCPQCHWINDELEDAYRQNVCRGWVPLTTLFAAGMMLISLFTGWYLSSGPRGNKAEGDFFLYLIPTGIVAVTAGVLVLVTILRSRVNLNRNFPWPPHLPIGIPPALVMDPVSEKLVVAVLPDTSLLASPDGAETAQTESLNKFEFHIGRHEMPDKCCLCLQIADPARTVVQTVYDTPIGLPLCTRCSTKKGMRTFGLTLVLILVSNVLLGFCVVALGWAPAGEVVMYGVLSLIPTSVFSLIIADALMRPVRIRHVSRERGVFRIEFKNSEFPKLILDSRSPSAAAQNVSTVQSDLLPFQSIEVEKFPTLANGRSLLREMRLCDYLYETETDGPETVRSKRVRFETLPKPMQRRKLNPP